MDRLYHGTSAARWEAIEQHGLVPRGAAESNWVNAPSRDDLVYLTDGAWAVHFARTAGEGDHLILEVDMKALIPELMLPDEDFLEQVSRGATRKRGGYPLPPKKMTDMMKRTAWFREHLFEYQQSWTFSLEHLGTCAYADVIKPEAITRAVSIRADHPFLIGFVDPTISLINHRIMGEHYRAMARWLMGESVAPRDVSFGPPPGYETEWEQQVTAVLANREGWRMLKG